MTVNIAMLGRDQKRIMASKCRPADDVRYVWAITTTQGTPLENVLNPDYWVEVYSRLQPGHLIEVRTDDETYFARLYVRAKIDRAVIVQLLEKYELGATPKLPHLSDEYEVKWKGPQLKWAVMRGDRKEPEHAGFENKEAAAAWLNEHLKAMAA